MSSQLPRINIIQHYLDKMEHPTYLEIGVEYGTSFLPIKAKRKIGIDPLFRTSKPRNAEFFQMTSNEFFQRHASKVLTDGISVAFVDGAHMYEQSLYDVENCLKYLKQNGTIVLHDCNPTTPSMAYPATSWEQARNANLLGWTGEWCGDVWKTIVRLRSTRNDLEIVVMNTDYGIGIIQHGEPSHLLAYSPGEIAALSYADLCHNREYLLHLIPAPNLQRSTILQHPLDRLQKIAHQLGLF